MDVKKTTLEEDLIKIVNENLPKVTGDVLIKRLEQTNLLENKVLSL